MERIRTTGTVVLVLAGSLALVGCQKALFPENAPRTQYDRYALLRGEARPAKEMSAQGSSPALRQRLRPLDQAP